MEKMSDRAERRFKTPPFHQKRRMSKGRNKTPCSEIKTSKELKAEYPPFFIS